MRSAGTSAATWPLGAELTLVPSEGGLSTRKLFLDMIEMARQLGREPHTYWIDQLRNQDAAPLRAESPPC